MSLVRKEHHDRTWQTGLVVRCRAFAAAAALAIGTPAGIAAADPPPPVCAVAVGEAVTLRSSDFDPDVLVWDARQRAIDYASGNVHNANDVLVHTVLSRPGTRAVVTACLPGTARPKYTTVVLDTIGVKITSGPHRGRYGWVSSDDVRSGHMSQASVTP
jgi:hypothetical protein